MSLAAGGAAAQPLDVSPGTLFYQAEDTVTITNRTDKPVVLDSVASRISQLRTYTAYFEIREPYVQRSGYPSDPGCRLPTDQTRFGADVVLAPGVEGQFTLANLDIYLPTRMGEMEPDTLLFYSGGAAVPDTVVIDFSRFVSARPAPDAAPPVRVAAFPNPAADRLTLRVETDRPAETEVVVTDALGRVVWRRRLGATAIANIPLPMREFAAGPYRVRVRTAEGGAEASFTVVR